MPTPVATLLCLGFILWLLRRSSKTVPSHAVGLWVPTVWIGIMISKPVTYWIYPMAARGDELQSQSALDGSQIERTVLTLLICAGLGVLLSRRVDWAAVLRQSPVIWLFYVYALLSVAWSPYPSVTLKRIIRDLGDVLMILIILTEPYPLDALKRVFVRCTLVLVPLSVLFIKYYPEIGRYYHRWTYQVAYAGVTTNKNSLGLLALVGALFLYWHIADSGKSLTRWQRLVKAGPEVGVFLLCMWLLNIANSATAVACFVLGILVLISSRTLFIGASVKATVSAIALVVSLGVVALAASDLRALVTQGLGRRPDLTERTDIWAGALALPINPLFGAGFSSVWLTSEGLALKDRIGGLAHAHNGYLETYLNGGFVGLALLIGILSLAAVQAGRHLFAKTAAGAFYVAVVLAGVVYNFTEVTFNKGNVIGFLLWLIALSAPTLVLVRRDVGHLDRRSSRSTRASPVQANRNVLRPPGRGARNVRSIRNLNPSEGRG